MGGVTGFGSQGPPDDPSNRPTQMADYSALEAPPGSDDQPAEPQSPPAPWYRKRSLLAIWATMVAILVVLIVYGLIQISRGGGGGTSTTTSSTTPSSTTTPSPTTTPSTTTTTPSTTTPTPSPSTPEERPTGGNASPPAQGPPSAEPPDHHHHLPHIPSTITLPHTVITLPHGF